MTAVSLNDNDRESYEQDPNSLTESEPWIARIGSISEGSNDVQRNEERIQKPASVHAPTSLVSRVIINYHGGDNP